MMAVQQPVLTVDQFDHWVQQPENISQRWEFIAGEFVEMVSNSYASEIAATILAAIQSFVKAHKLGRVTGADGGYHISGERYIPDVAFISFGRQPKSSRAAYNPNPPELAVEVVSNAESVPERDQLRIKVSNYLAVGTVVWIVRPEDQQIEIHAPGQAVRVYSRADTLDGAPVLPGFTLPLADVFEEAPE